MMRDCEISIQRYNLHSISRAYMMRVHLKLLPAQKGKKTLLSKYGDDLLCVRYRCDEATCRRSIPVVLEF